MKVDECKGVGVGVGPEAVANGGLLCTHSRVSRSQVIDASNVRELLDYASRVTPPLETLNQKL